MNRSLFERLSSEVRTGLTCFMTICVLLNTQACTPPAKNVESHTQPAVNELKQLLAEQKRIIVAFPKAMSEARRPPNVNEGETVLQFKQATLTSWLDAFELLALNVDESVDITAVYSSRYTRYHFESQLGNLGLPDEKSYVGEKLKAFNIAKKEHSDMIDASNFQSRLHKAKDFWLVFFDNLIKFDYSQESEKDYQMLINAISKRIPKGVIRDDLIKTVNKRWGKTG